MGLCKTFGCLPSQLMAEDASVLRLMRILELGTPEPAAADDGGDW